ncbi:MAG TPA: right-handed parallel beta-helix repeat-containing protein [Anaerolineae bacterium]|nr:right-handed parallel beta-helix repeat-containing protein [Anaerolineae bacterium]
MERGMRFLLALALVGGTLLAAAPAALAEEPNEVWVCPSGNCDSTPSYSTIQAGIGAVAAGGTVHVAAGAYTGNLTIGKALTLDGAGAGTTSQGSIAITTAGVTVRGLTFVGSSGSGTTGHIMRLNAANGAVIEGCTLTWLGSYENAYGLWLQGTSNAAIRNVTVSGVSGSLTDEMSTQVAGIRVEGGGDNAFEQVAVTGVTGTKSVHGVQLRDGAQRNSFTGLTVSGVNGSGECCPLNGISVESGSANHFDGATISGLGTAGFVRGVYLSGAPGTYLRRVRVNAAGSVTANGPAGFSLTGSSSGVLIDEGEVTGAKQGVWAESGSATLNGCLLTDNAWGVDAYAGATVAIHNSSIYGNSQFGVQNRATSGADVDASDNWWGSPTGPKIASNPGGEGQSVSTRVAYRPWLSDGTDSEPETAGFQPKKNAPEITGLEPGWARAGAAGLSLVVRGTGFSAGAQVRWNDAARPTQYDSETQLTADIAAADLAPGTAQVTVANPDGQVSAAREFVVHPAPATVYVDAAWAGLAADADPDGAGPATRFGYDAFATMQGALDAVARGGRVLLVGAACSGGATVTTPELTIDLNGATVGGGSPAFTVMADNVTIDDGILDGTGAGSDDPAILVAAGVARLWVHDCEIKNWGGDGIHCSGPSSDVKIIDNWIHDNGGDGTAFAAAPTGTVLIRGNSFRDNAGAGINAAGSVTAKYNEWGHVGGPAAGDGISGNVLAEPWVYGRVWVDAAEAQVHEGAEFDVTVLVEAKNLHGAQFTLSYPAAMLKVLSATPSGAEGFGATQGTVAWNNATGTLSYAYSQQGETAYSGTGALVTVRFQALEIAGDAASAALDLDADSVKLAALGGVKVRVDAVGDDSVDILGTAAVSGVVRLQGRGDWSGASVDAGAGERYGADPAAVTTDAWGRYGFSATADTYLVTIRMARYLPASARVAISGAQVLGMAELLGGDLDGVDGVYIDDITIISGLLFGTGVDAATTPADINYDGWVDILDLVLAAGNFGKTASPWAG